MVLGVRNRKMALGTSDISLSRENIVEKLCRLAWRHSFSFLLVGNAMCRRIIAFGGGVRCEAEIAQRPRPSCKYSGRLLPEKYEFGWVLIVGGMMLSVRPLWPPIIYLSRYALVI